MRGVDLKYEFAGLNLLNGTTQTHYFMPKSVGNITFVTPGQAFGNNNAIRKHASSTELKD